MRLSKGCVFSKAPVTGYNKRLLEDWTEVNMIFCERTSQFCRDSFLFAGQDFNVNPSLVSYINVLERSWHETGQFKYSG